MELEFCMIQLKDETRIENPREYDDNAIENLRHLLRARVPAQPDPRRENFYEIKGLGETFYIHVSPVSGNVVLLAKWLSQLEECCVVSDRLVA
jgi:hypothetical protein